MIASVACVTSAAALSLNLRVPCRANSAAGMKQLNDVQAEVQRRLDSLQLKVPYMSRP